MLKLLEKILRDAALASDNKGIYFIEKGKEEFVNYKRLYTESKQCGQWMKEKGIRQGDSIIILVKDKKSFLTILWACFINGYTAVPMDCLSSAKDILGLENIKNVFKSIASVKILTDKTQLNYLEQSYRDSINDTILFPGCEELELYMPEKISVPTNEEFPVIILFTSGSVSTPKGIVINKANIFSSIHQVVERVHYNDSDVIINWMPLTHVAGLILLHIIPIYSKADEVILANDFLVRYPKDFLSLIGKYSGTVTMLPNFAVELLVNFGKLIDLMSYKLDCLRCVFNGAEPINYGIVQEFADTYNVCGFNRNAMLAIYGMTESTIALTMHDPDKNEDKFYSINKDKYFSENSLLTYCEEIGGEQYVLAYVGTPMAGLVIKICDENGKELEQGNIGNIMVKGPNIARTFINTQGSHSLLGDDHYLDTGDMGCFINDQLIITGRKKDVIFFNGLNFYPEDIENICKKVLEDLQIECLACAVTNPDTLKDELVIFLEFNLSEAGDIEKRVKEMVSKTINQPVKHVIFVKAISKNRIGKKQRYMMKRQFEKGEFNNYIIKGDYYGKNQ